VMVRAPLSDIFGAVAVMVALGVAASVVIYAQGSKPIDQIPVTAAARELAANQTCVPHASVKPKAITVTRDRQDQHLTHG
jgi:hypothetical protein